MTDEKFKRLMTQAQERYANLSPGEKAAHDEAQRQSWVRGMAPCKHGVRDWETCPQCRDKAPAPAARSPAARLREHGKLWGPKVGQWDAELASFVRDAEDAAEALEKAETVLGEIADQDVTEIALDPDWPKRMAADWHRKYGRDKDNG